jgi:hypothetical protein
MAMRPIFGKVFPYSGSEGRSRPYIRDRRQRFTLPAMASRQTGNSNFRAAPPPSNVTAAEPIAIWSMAASLARVGEAAKNNLDEGVNGSESRAS